jgi:hypothetical protein
VVRGPLERPRATVQSLMVVRAGIVPDNDLNDRGSCGLPPIPI